MTRDEQENEGVRANPSRARWAKLLTFACIAHERSIVFFVRSERARPLHDALLERAHPFDDVPMAVYSGKGLDHRDLVAPFIPDDYGHIAAAFRMPWPRDGGPPVGYAVADSHGMVRYRALDPTVWKRLKEVETIRAATP